MKFTYNNKEYELLFLSVAGSRLYGNPRPDSDWDYRGVIKETVKDKISLLSNTDQLQGPGLYKTLKDLGLNLHETDDIELYEITKFVKLARDNNPNIMDFLCMDYNNPQTMLYLSNQGKELLDNKDLFLSKKSKFTFSGYGVSQLKRIKNHKKFISEFPHTNKVLEYLKNLYNNQFIDFQFISDNFGGQVAEKVTNETAQDHKNLKVVISWESLEKGIDINIEKYRVPRLIDYIKVYDIAHRELGLNTALNEVDTIEDSLLGEATHGTMNASFRKLGENTYSVFSKGSGIFTKEGNIKANESENIGDFICILKADKNLFKQHKDRIQKMWNWKCNRNEKRAVLENKYGFDSKHASHLVRLLLKAEQILLKGVYTPELNEEELKLVTEVKNGEKTYEWIVQWAENKDKELDELYKTTNKIQNKPQFKKINNLLLRIYNV